MYMGAERARKLVHYFERKTTKVGLSRTRDSLLPYCPGEAGLRVLQYNQKGTWRLPRLKEAANEGKTPPGSELDASV